MIATTIEIHLTVGDMLVISVAGVDRICHTSSDQPMPLRIRWMRKIPDLPYIYDFTSHGDMFRAFERYQNTRSTNKYTTP